jgi:hypothetical protein
MAFLLPFPQLNNGNKKYKHFSIFRRANCGIRTTSTTEAIPKFRRLFIQHPVGRHIREPEQHHHARDGIPPGELSAKGKEMALQRLAKPKLY